MVFVGRGYAKQQLQSLVSEMGIAKSVIFHEVVYDRELLRAIYARGGPFPVPFALRQRAPRREGSGLHEDHHRSFSAGTTAAEVIHDGSEWLSC